MKRLEIGPVLISIFEAILAENKTQDEWAEIESDDLIQEGPFVGGYDATEEAFCFSYYEGEKEYWFQITEAKIRQSVAGQLTEIELRPADKKR